MSEPEPNDLSVEPEDAPVLDALNAGRPAPSPTFRTALAARLSQEDPGWGPRPERLWPQSLALVALGAALLIVGALVGVGGT